MIGKNHPFAVDAFFERSLVLTFAVPRAKVADLIPPCFEPDVLHNEWAMLAVAMVQTKDLRPAGFPTWMGSNFRLIGHRIFVRYRTRAGKNLRGLYILRSETDSLKMTLLGNIFTRYAYVKTDISFVVKDKSSTIRSAKSALHVSLAPAAGNTPLPGGSPFATWQEARKFAGPMPYTFGYDDTRKEVVIVEGVRKHWKPVPVIVSTYTVGFLHRLHVPDAVLASAFETSAIPYHWKKGSVEKWG